MMRSESSSCRARRFEPSATRPSSRARGSYAIPHWSWCGTARPIYRKSIVSPWWRNRAALAHARHRLKSWYASTRIWCRKSIASTWRRDELGVALFPDQLVITRVGGWRRQPLQKEIIGLAPAADDAPRWKPALEVLAAKVFAGELSGADVTVVLSNHFVHYVLVPWSDALSKEE